jgi:hypothetical protein
MHGGGVLQAIRWQANSKAQETSNAGRTPMSGALTTSSMLPHGVRSAVPLLRARDTYSRVGGFEAGGIERRRRGSAI